jgi:hypothetical protein
MKYNTERKRLPMPEYGRAIQDMIDYALTIENREERQRCASSIIAIMGNMFPHLRDVPDFKHKLWDHLAIMSDFKLDIDDPYDIIKKDSLETKPEPLPYPQKKIVYRHYGRTITEMLQKAVEYPDTPDKDRLIYLLANQMKKDYSTWNKEGVDDQKIFDDILELTNGAILITPDAMKLEEIGQSISPTNNINNARRKTKNPRRPKNNF